MIADDASGTDDDSRSVVDGEMMPDLCARMNVDACFRVCHFRNDTWEESYSQKQELVGDAVVADGAYGGIATDDFAEAGSGRVTIIGGFYIGGKDAPYFGQLADELGSQQGSSISVGLDFQSIVLLSEAKSCLDLFGCQIEQTFYVYTDVVRNRMFVDGGISEISGE